MKDRITTEGQDSEFAACIARTGGLRRLPRSSFLHDVGTALQSLTTVRTASAVEGGRKPQTMPDRPRIVFVHGLWAGGSSLGNVISARSGKGPTPGTSPPYAARCDRPEGRVPVVGHSYRGRMVTAAGTDDHVAGMPHSDALVPGETETSQSQHGKFKRQTCPTTSKSRTGASGHSWTMWTCSPETCRSRSNGSSAQPTLRPTWICSTRTVKALRGARSRAGNIVAKMIARPT